MKILNFNNLKNLNTSLQVGDAVYAHSTTIQDGSYDAQAGFDDAGANHFVGVLRKIEKISVAYKDSNNYKLHVDDNPTSYPFSDKEPYVGTYYTPKTTDFIMFSKFEQGDSGVLGYYAKARFVNNSKEKVELFAVSSEIIINSN